MKKIFLLSIISLCIFIGCNKDGNQGDEVPQKDSNAVYSGNYCSGNYLEHFIIPNVLYAPASKGETSWGFTIIPEDSTREKIYPWFIDKALKNEILHTKFNEYAKYYGDTSYTESHNMDLWQDVMAAPLNSVNIVCDRDFDEDHLVGTPLNDIVYIHYFSAYDFIKNGYNYDFFVDSLVPLQDLKPISILGDAYTKLLCKKFPAPGKYTFTVTLDFGNDPLTGEKVTVPPANIEIEF